MIRRLLLSATGAIALGFAASCASGGGALPQMGPDSLLDFALQAMEDDDLDDAVAALERFVFSFPGSPRRQEARYQLAVVYHRRKEYISAANEFERLAADYPTGPYADDAQFGVCESYYELSPEPQLDPEFTQLGIQHCEAVVQYHPDSPDVPRAIELRDEMIEKLATKKLLQARTYVRLQGWDSAIIYFESLLRQFPESEAVPKALYGLYQAYDKVGDTEGVDRVRQRLLQEYPDTEEARRVINTTPRPRP